MTFFWLLHRGGESSFPPFVKVRWTRPSRLTSTAGDDETPEYKGGIRFVAEDWYGVATPLSVKS
jgi:hypothetical protein